MTSKASQPPEFEAMPRIPKGPDDDLVFAHPWEAKAFALVVSMHQAGHFAWQEWVDQLAAEIAAAGSEDDGSGYYLLWLNAAEKLVAAKHLCAETDLKTRKHALEAAQGGPAPAVPSAS